MQWVPTRCGAAAAAAAASFLLAASALHAVIFLLRRGLRCIRMHSRSRVLGHAFQVFVRDEADACIIQRLEVHACGVFNAEITWTAAGPAHGKEELVRV
jgi:hypothetical protein